MVKNFISGLNASTNLSIYDEFPKSMSFDIEKKCDFKSFSYESLIFTNTDIGLNNSSFLPIPIQYENLFKIQQLESEIKDLKCKLDISNTLKKNILTVKDVAVITGYKIGYIYQLIHKQEIPVYYTNNRKSKPYFKREEIENWLTECKVKSIYDLELEANAYNN